MGQTVEAAVRRTKVDTVFDRLVIEIPLFGDRNHIVTLGFRFSAFGIFSSAKATLYSAKQLNRFWEFEIVKSSLR
jgi:hypothetical protein